MLKCFILLFFLFHIGAIKSNAQSLERICRYPTKWKTVDNFIEDEVRYVVPHAMATSGNTVFVAGTATGSAGGWVVRRSLNRGETWVTVDRYQRSDFEYESAGGIAVDQRTRHIYTVGALSHEDGNPAAWVVRKSIDNGATWTTVDEIVGSKGARKIAIDSRGIVYVVGTWDGAGGFLRRSIDGGRTWRTVVFSSSLMNGYSVVTAPNGRVFIGAVDSRHGWHIFTSLNGLTGWEDVDHLPSLSGAEYGSPADAHITRDGRLLFTGVMPRFGGLVRTARFDRFREWRNLVAFAETRTVAATSRDGKIFITGVVPHVADDRYVYYTTWLGAATGGFTVHDQFRQDAMAFGSPVDHAYGAAAVTGYGDVLTTQFWNPESTVTFGSNWIVRKLRCY